MSDYYNPYEKHGNDYKCNDQDYEQMAQNYTDWSRFSRWTPQQRLNAAKNFGPNWACILSGIGDQ